MREEAQVQLKDLLGIVFTLIVTGAALAYGLEFLKEAGDDLATCGDAEYPTYNDSSGKCENINGTSISNNTFPDGAESLGIRNTTVAMSKVPEKLPTVTAVIMAALILGVLTTLLIRRFA